MATPSYESELYRDALFSLAQYLIKPVTKPNRRHTGEFATFISALKVAMLPGEIGSITENVESQFIHIANVTPQQFICQLRFMQHAKGRSKLEVYLLMMLRYLFTSHAELYAIDSSTINPPARYSLVTDLVWRELKKGAAASIEEET